MTSRLYIENPPPFRFQAPSGSAPASVPIEDGVEVAREYLRAGVPLAGFHHSDLDTYEAKRRGSAERDLSRYDTFSYAALVHRRFDRRRVVTAPHRIVVYRTPAEQEDSFRKLAASGIRNVVLVGKPYTRHPDGVAYRSSVEEMLAHLSGLEPKLDLHLGVIGIHSRRGEARRIADKFEAAGGRLRVLGQFVDESEAMEDFLDRLAGEFERRRLDLDQLEWNVGLAVFALENRKFYAQLLRKDELACEHRFAGLGSMDRRLAASHEMDLEFAERIIDRARGSGVRVGFSIQPIIERFRNGRLHPSVHAAVRVGKSVAALTRRPSRSGAAESLSAARW